MRIVVAVVLGWVELAAGSNAAVLSVGPNKPYSNIEDALGNARRGDTVRVHPKPDNAAYPKVALNLRVPEITLEAVIPPGGARIPLSGKGFDYSGQGRIPRAIIQVNPGADGCRIHGFELLEAHNSTHNGAGIRINQANQVQIRNCEIHRNDMGIMSNGAGSTETAAEQWIEGCLIHHNGSIDEPGQNHNLYLGGTSVTVTGCEIHTSLTGHNLKSRAHQTRVVGCFIHDSANRELDLVDSKADTVVAGSDAVVACNVIVKAAACEGNRAVVHFGQDGGNEHDGTLYLIHNTIVTPYISPVVHLTAGKARTYFLNNVVWDGGTPRQGQVLVSVTAAEREGAVTGSGNWLAAGFRTGGAAAGLRRTVVAGAGEAIGFVRPAAGDYRLAERVATIVDAGEPVPDAVLRQTGLQLVQYQPPLQVKPRAIHGKPDLGAFEWTQAER